MVQTVIENGLQTAWPFRLQTPRCRSSCLLGLGIDESSDSALLSSFITSEYFSSAILISLSFSGGKLCNQAHYSPSERLGTRHERTGFGTPRARSIWPKFRNFRMLNGTVFSTRPNRSCPIPTWAHFPPRITRENAAGSWWSGCLKCRIKLLRVEKFKKHSEFNSSLIFMRETYELFSRKSMANWPTGNSGGTTSPQFSRQSDPNVFVFDQEQARAVADHFASSVVSTRQTYSPPSWAFHD